MRRCCLKGFSRALAPVLLAAAGGSALAREGPPPPPPDRWQDSAELSYVVTAGNSETNTLGFKNKLWRQWERSGFELNAGGVRSKASTRFAVGTPSSFDIEDESKLTAESYYLNGRYNRKVTERFLWFASVGWERNTFAGIDNRYSGAAGVGNAWVDTETLKFRTDYSVTWTREDDVVDDPSTKDTFAGARLSSSYLQKFGSNTTVTNDLIVDDNLDDTSDLRANMITSVTVAMSKRLALKASLQWLYDHQPALGAFELFDVTGVSIGTVNEELDTLDTIFTTSLVINF